MHFMPFYSVLDKENSFMDPMPRKIHGDIQRQLDRYTDLIPVDLHALWDKSDAQFVQCRMLGSNVITSPLYWYSPSTRHQLGLWEFNETDRLPHGQVVQQTALISLLDDVTAELATRLVAMLHENQVHIGFTVNLNITSTGCSSSSSSSLARLFYFDAHAIELAGRKAIVECPLYDAESGKQLLLACATFIFVPLNDVATKIESMVSKEQQQISNEPLLLSLDDQGTQDIGASDLHDLSQVMNFLPHGLVSHKIGSYSAIRQQIAVLVDFGDNLNGPPNHVHGGILATVLYNASELLLSKTIAGISKQLISASVRDINYRKGVPTESKDVFLDAVVEDISANSVVILAKLTNGSKVYTTLRTTFTICVPASKL